METGKGYPDITLLEPIASVFKVSVTELISGNTVSNVDVAANMLRTNFYVCPVCGNIIHSVGEALVSCHGITLNPLEAETSSDRIQIVKLYPEGNPEARFEQVGTVPTCTVGKWGLSLLVQN